MGWFKNIVGRQASASTAQQQSTQQPNAYDSIGGEPVVRAIAIQFYRQMQIQAGAKPLLAMHRAPLEISKQKLFEFLSGWLGGPPLFEQKYGHPALRRRHMPFKIDDAMRDQWLGCMHAALELEVSDPQHRQAIFEAISRLADHMRNQ